MATAFQAQLISLVCEGVFERFPTLRIVLIEGGFAWLAPLMWRLDRAWTLLRAEVPRPDAAAVRADPRARLADDAADGGAAAAADFVAMLEQLGMDDRIMFATDYPHWDFDAPERALPSGARRAAAARDHGRQRARALPAAAADG